MSDKIPFLDLVTPHRELEDELVKVFREALNTGRFIGGPDVEGFEQDFARFCETEFCVGVGSGTDALRFALIAAGVKPGETVLTVPNTFIATVEAISQAGATPEFVDIDELTYNIDSEKLREHLTNNCRWDSKTKRLTSIRTGQPISAIVPVHLYGQPADMDPILRLAAQHDLLVIEDACQAHGAQYFSSDKNRWCSAGSMGDAAAFSFYPGKNLGACGEGGAVVTNRADLAEQVKILRDHGQVEKHRHRVEGYNGRLDAIQAGILRVKLRHLDEWNVQRRLAASYYNELLSESPGLISPFESDTVTASFHLYVIRSRRRDDLAGYLGSKGIQTALHYPVPIHLQDAYAALGYGRGSFPVSEQYADQILSLPMFPGLTKARQRRIVREINRFISIFMSSKDHLARQNRHPTVPSP